jgi:hypothetical protein
MQLPDALVGAIDEALKLVYSYQPLAEKTLVLGECDLPVFRSQFSGSTR